MVILHTSELVSWTKAFTSLLHRLFHFTKLGKIEWYLLSNQPHFLWTWCYCVLLFLAVGCLQFLHVAKNISHCSLFSFCNSLFLIHPPVSNCSFPQSLISFHLSSDFYSFSLVLDYLFSHLPHFSNPVLCLFLILNYTFLQICNSSTVHLSLLFFFICWWYLSWYAFYYLLLGLPYWGKSSICSPELTNLQTVLTSQLADQLSVVNRNGLHISPASWEVCPYHVNWY